MVYSLRSRSKSPSSSQHAFSSIPSFSDENEVEDDTTTADLFDDNNNYRAESPTYENGYMFRRKRSVTGGSNNISLTIGGINGKIQIPNGVIKPIPRKAANDNSEVRISPQHPRHQLMASSNCKPAKRARHRIHSVDDILDNTPKKKKTRASIDNNKEKINNSNFNILNDTNNNNNNNNNITNNKNAEFNNSEIKFNRYSRTNNTNQKKSPNYKDGDGKLHNFYNKFVVSQIYF